VNSLAWYSFSKTLGLMIFIIRRTIMDLSYFVLILCVFWFGFGVTTQALMYYNQSLNSDLLKNVFFPSYFVIADNAYTISTILSASIFLNLFNFFKLKTNLHWKRLCFKKIQIVHHKQLMVKIVQITWALKWLSLSTLFLYYSKFS